MAGSKKMIGILALQGDFREHYNSLLRLPCKPVLVKNSQVLDEIDGLIIPGGESTSIRKLLIEYNFMERIIQLAAEGMPIMGTCAGMILLANNTEGEIKNINLNLIDITVERNAYGRQIDSYETYLSIPELGREPFPAIFIRAPKIIYKGNDVEVLAAYGENPVMVRENNIVTLSFHPELTADLRIHQYFLDMI